MKSDIYSLVTPKPFGVGAGIPYGGVPDFMVRGQGAPVNGIVPIDEMASLNKVYGAGNAKEQDITQRQQAETAPIQSQLADLTQQRTDLMQQGPKQAELPINTAQHMSKEEMQQTGNWLMLAASLMGALTRQPLTAALGNITAAMKGLHEGDQEQYDRSMKEYEANFRKAEGIQKQYDTEYNKLMSNLHTTYADKERELNLLNLKYGKELDRNTKDVAQREKLVQTTAKMFADQSATMERIKQREEEARQRREERKAQLAQSTGGGISADAIKMMADRYRLEGPEGLRALSAFDKTTRRAVIEQATKDALAAGGDGAGMAKDAAAFKADKAALNAITKDIAAIRPYHDMLEGNAQILKELGAKLSRTDSPWANKTLNYLQTHPTSDPDVTEYLAQMRLVQTESARVINNPRLVGQLTDTARKEIENIVNGDMAIETTNRVVDRLLNDATRRITAMENEQARLLQRKPTTPAQPQNTDQPPPKEQRIPGVTVWRGHTWQTDGWH
jgi:hypothetical protein